MQQKRERKRAARRKRQYKTEEAIEKQKQMLQELKAKGTVKRAKWETFVKEDYDGIERFKDGTIYQQLMMEFVLVEYKKKGQKCYLH